jgi:hypothetical protein
MQLLGKIRTEEWKDLLNIIDPLAYKEQLAKIPKLVITASGDEFFPPDGHVYWWDEMHGEKHYRVFPGIGHQVDAVFPEIEALVAAFSVSVFSNTPRPEYTWAITNGSGQIDLYTAATPRVSLWAANSTTGTGKRDFRYTVCPDCPTSQAHLGNVSWVLIDNDVQPIAPGHYTALLPLPPQNSWKAFFLQMDFPSLTRGEPAMTLTTGTSIIPQTFPYPPCQTEAECQAWLT